MILNVYWEINRILIDKFNLFLMVVYGRRNIVLNYKKKIKLEMIKMKLIRCFEFCVRGCYFDDFGFVINED